MARQPSISHNSIPSANAANDGKLRRIVLAKVTPDGKVDLLSTVPGTLLLNPEFINDDKTSNWVMNNIPGQSNPILQWVSGGARTVSFEALVTKDTSDFLKKKDDPIGDLTNKAINAVGSIAASFIGVNLPSISSFMKTDSESGSGNQLSIAENLNYYRSLLYPVYQSGRLYTSPPIIAILSGQALSTANTDPGTGSISDEHDLWVLTDLKIKETKFLPNLNPMEAMVSFTFIQYATKSIGQDHFSQERKTTPKIGNSITQTLSGILS